MGAGALTICHNKAAVQVKEDMKRMVQLPMLRPRATEANGTRLFGVSLLELRELGLVEGGVPLVVRGMVEHLRQHGLHQEGLFRVNGNVRAVETLRRRLDSGEDVDFLSEADVFTVASLLKQYLRDLPEGLVNSTVQPALIQQHQECGDDGSCSDLRVLLQQLPDVHYSLLRYLCHFLTQVECHHQDNRMTALNLATVFGPNVFHVSPGFEAMKDQNICNKIMAKLLQNYSSIFDSHTDTGDTGGCMEELPTLIIVKEAHVTQTDAKKSPSSTPTPKTPTPFPRKKKAPRHSPPDNTDTLNQSSSEHPTATPRKKKVRKGKSDDLLQASAPRPSPSAGLPHVRPLPMPIMPPPLTPERRGSSPEKMEMTPPPPPDHQEPLQPPVHDDHADVSPSGSIEALNSCPVHSEHSQNSNHGTRSQEEERPISPFYMSNHLSPVYCRPDVVNFLDRTIRSAVVRHLFDVNPLDELSSEESEVTPRPPCPPAVATPTARQRRRQKREQHEEVPGQLERSRADDINKENIPASSAGGVASVSTVSLWEERRGRAASRGGQNGHQTERTPKPRKSKHSPTLLQLTDNQDAHTVKECIGASKTHERPEADSMELFENGKGSPRKGGPPPPRALSMKIQESPITCDTGRVSVGGGVRDPDRESCEDVPRLDLTALTEDNNWGDTPFFSAPFLDFKSIFHQSCCDEPVPAYSSWQRESMDREEARLSPHAGGRLIRQLLEEDSDPMLSPRFHAYGHCQQYLDDTEVPPSPPNAHSFVSRRRSSSLGSCDDEKEELTSAQLSKRIHGLKRKIRKFEEKFEDERKYRPSHSDKAANPEVLRWMNELAKLRKDLKEHKLLKSEEDLTPMTRQRSNTLPKSFGSQLEKKPQQEKVPKPPVESTLEVVLNKLQEKRQEVGRPEDIKDMTREQIGAEKVALQKALLYYESIHGRPVTKSERQIMKPLYDRYRLVKQILCRASTIPVIGSPSSKRRGPLLQPIIEGEPALFFDDIKEEEDGSEDDGESKPQFTVTVRPDFSMLGFLDQLDEEADGFISPVDELSPSKNTTDMRLSNLHSATMQELVEQLQETREEKKRIRKNLREFEDQFFRQNGRNVQKEDRSPLAAEYNEYKHVKAKLRLLEVLISKRDSTKFI